MITDDQFLQIAKTIAQSATCSRLSVGAVLVKDNRIVSIGYNGTARGLEHCHHDDDKPCHKSVHAEANVIAFAARAGISTLGSHMYVTHAPCEDCAGLIINAGVEWVRYETPYRNDKGLDALILAGIPSLGGPYREEAR